MTRFKQRIVCFGILLWSAFNLFGASDPNETTVQANIESAASRGYVDIPLHVNAGNDTLIIAESFYGFFALDGSYSGGNEPVHIEWELISGPVDFEGVNSNHLLGAGTNNAYVSGVYTYKLTATDADGDKASDDVTITMHILPSIEIPSHHKNQTICLPQNHVSLYAGVGDYWNNNTSYTTLWVQKSGPSVANISQAHKPITEIYNLEEGKYIFTFQLTDEFSNIISEDVTINVLPEGSGEYISLGSNYRISPGSYGVCLKADISNIESPVRYLWSQANGPSFVEIYAPESLNLQTSTEIYNHPGDYTFKFELYDADNNYYTDDITITVKPDQTRGSSTIPADLWGASMINLYGFTDTFAISFPYSVLSAITLTRDMNYHLIKDFPGRIEFYNLHEGLHAYNIIYMTKDGDVSSTDIQINVYSEDTEPIIKITNNQIVQLPQNRANMLATVTSRNRAYTLEPYEWLYTYEPLDINWQQISGPEDTYIFNNHTTAAYVEFETEGLYVYEVSVTDVDGDTTTETIEITVLPETDIPTVYAGEDITQRDMGYMIELQSSITGGNPPYNIQWNQLSGPNNAYIQNVHSLTPKLYWLREGTYTFTITITDADGDIATDEIQITIEPQHPCGRENNLAFGKTCYATPGSFQAIPESITDGDISTKWTSKYTNQSFNGYKNWIYVDLENLVDISRIETYWDWRNNQQFELQISNDAANWTTIYSGISSYGYRGINTNNSIGRYVRIFFNDNHSDYRNTIYEIYVYGCVQYIDVENIEISPSELTLTEGTSSQLQTIVTPEYATFTNINWESDDEYVATVSSTGVVTAHTEGYAIITATSTDGSVSADCILEVIAPEYCLSYDIPEAADFLFKNQGADQLYGSGTTNTTESLVLTQKAWGLNFGYFIMTGEPIDITEDEEYYISMDIQSESDALARLEVGICTDYAWYGPTYYVQPLLEMTDDFTSTAYSTVQTNFTATESADNVYLVIKSSLTQKPQTDIQTLIKNLNFCSRSEILSDIPEISTSEYIEENFETTTEDINEAYFTISPNIASSENMIINLYEFGENEDAIIRVVDAQGMPIINTNIGTDREFTINSVNLFPGVYIVNINGITNRFTIIR